LVFGKESVGLSKEVLEQFENHLTIPMSSLIRSFNIANSVAFVVGEAKRQIGLKV
jgi:tRNA (cytidine/uridine-2'-O-)-methyltransferase